MGLVQHTQMFNGEWASSNGTHLMNDGIESEQAGSVISNGHRDEQDLDLCSITVGGIKAQDNLVLLVTWLMTSIFILIN